VTARERAHARVRERVCERESERGVLEWTFE